MCKYIGNVNQIRFMSDNSRPTSQQMVNNSVLSESIVGKFLTDSKCLSLMATVKMT
jgi:hypothetical protein